MSLEHAQQVPRRDLPKLERFVVNRECIAPVGRERSHRMPLDRFYQPARICAPELRGLVLASGEQGAPVRRKGDPHHTTRMPLEGSQQAPSVRIPELNSLILAP